MTRKHYRIIADSLNQTKPSHQEIEATRQWRQTVNRLANELKADNPKFNIAIFLNAAGFNDL